MKKNFTIKAVSNKLQIFSTTQESNNHLKLMDRAVCCDWAVGIIGKVVTTKSLVIN